MREFGLTARAAHMAIDRTLGGVTRAASKSPELYPDQSLDPIAWHSFQRACADTTIINAIYPHRNRDARQTNESRGPA
jgi:hypothetical protein